MAIHSKTREKFAMKVRKYNNNAILKIIEKEKVKREDLIDTLKKEISILMMIDHPNIVKL